MYVLDVVHRGNYGMHTRGRNMATRFIRAGYSWSRLRADCIEYVKKCKECQEFSNVHYTPLEELHNITFPWPFAMWGMDILRPFPITKTQIKFLLITMDYTKWIEAEPLENITTQKVQKITWKNIIYRYDLPEPIMTDNRKQFMEKGYEDFLKQLDIRHLTSLAKHPQTNGQVEAANKVILTELRKTLSKIPKGLWVDELPSMFWGYHCTPQSATQETPFRLTYGTKAMILVEIDEPSL